jgi:hypothetical protein
MQRIPKDKRQLGSAWLSSALLRKWNFDMGATCHIFPERSDFKTLQPIPRYPVKGVGGTCVHAVGIGQIELTIGKGRELHLQNALFIPTATVRLLFVLELNRQDSYTTHFDSSSCWMTDNSNIVIARGTVCTIRSLYTLSRQSPPLVSPLRRGVAHAAHLSRVPDLATWHNRLGHCNIQTILDMVRDNVADGDVSIHRPNVNIALWVNKVARQSPKFVKAQSSLLVSPKFSSISPVRCSLSPAPVFDTL